MPKALNEKRLDSLQRQSETALRAAVRWTPSGDSFLVVVRWFCKSVWVGCLGLGIGFLVLIGVSLSFRPPPGGRGRRAGGGGGRILRPGQRDRGRFQQLAFPDAHFGGMHPIGAGDLGER